MQPQETHVPPGRAGLGCILKSFYSLAGKLTLVLAIPVTCVGMRPGGQCALGQCIWFSNYTFITGEPTLPGRYYLDHGYLSIYLYLYPDYMRTFNDITINPGWEFDFTKTHPWRHPGSAPVYRWEVLLSAALSVLYCTALYCTVLYCIQSLRRVRRQPRGVSRGRGRAG